MSPEEIQAKFWADFGNGVLNIANFTGAIAQQNKEVLEEMAAIRTELQDFNANFRTFLNKAYQIPMDELDGLESEGPEDEPS